MSTETSTDELRVILARLPHKRLVVRTFADLRNRAEVPAMADLWCLLMAEVAAADDRERAALEDALEGVAMEFTRPPDDTPEAGPA